MNMITPAIFETEMRNIAEREDDGFKHMDADNLLCRVLNSLGYEAGVRIYGEMKLTLDENKQTDKILQQ